MIHLEEIYSIRGINITATSEKYYLRNDKQLDICHDKLLKIV